MKRSRRSRPLVRAPWAFAGFRVRPDVILLVVRWFLTIGPSSREVEVVLAERGIEVVDVHVCKRSDRTSARRFFTTSLTAHCTPTEVITVRAPPVANVIRGLIPATFHNTGKYENNRWECDHGR